MLSATTTAAAANTIAAKAANLPLLPSTLATIIPRIFLGSTDGFLYLPAPQL
jgi:hypothetical protein